MGDFVFNSKNFRLEFSLPLSSFKYPTLGFILSGVVLQGTYRQLQERSGPALNGLVFSFLQILRLVQCYSELSSSSGDFCDCPQVHSTDKI